MVTFFLDEDVFVERSLTKRYSTSSVLPAVVRGSIALTRQGEDFALSQLAHGINAFSGTIDCSVDKFQELFQLEDSESDLDENGTDDDSDFGVDDLGCEQPLCVLPQDDKDLESVTGELVCDGVICWKLPASVSQSTLAGDNGSNACSIIATLLGNRFMEGDLEIPDDVTSPLDFTWINTICECISIGNMVYDTYRDALPNRYLSIEEAIEMLSGVLSAQVNILLPVRYLDPHKPSTVEEQLKQLMNVDKCVAHFIMHERTSAFLIQDGKIVYADSHLHLPSGAVLISASQDSLHSFCSYIWDIEAFSESEFGNLVLTSYPDT